MNRNLIFTAVATGSLLLSACGTSSDTSTETETETVETPVTEETTLELEQAATSPADMVLFTAMTSRLQTQLSDVAQEKAPSEAVQELGQEIEQSNNQIMVKIQDLAEALQAELPSTLSVDQQAIYDSLQELSPEEFQGAYVEVLQRDIQKNLENLENLAAETDSEIVRGLAADIADLQQPQLESVEQVQQEMM